MALSGTTRELNYQVYLVTNRVNGKKYVGKTVYTARHRWWGHCKDARNGKSTPLARAISKHGECAFIVEVLYEGSSEREILAVEKAMIAQYRTLNPHGYNICVGGQGTSGRKMSTSQKEAVRARMIGNTNGRFNKGVRHTPEAVANNSAAQKKLTISAETRAKMADARRGKKRPHVGAAISLAKRGKPVPGNYKAVICVSNDTIYQSIKTAAREMNLSVGAISWALSSPTRTARGHNFVYAVEK